MTPTPTRAGDRLRSAVTTVVPAPRAAKVPEITFLFWVIKVLTTGMGEAASDWLAATNLILAGGVGLIGFVIGMWLQFRATVYRPTVYWFAVAMVAVFGTMAADALHKGLGLPYWFSTTFYAVLLAIVFVSWQRSQGTLSIHSITTRRRETFYWITVLVTFALGTAAGDLAATTLGLGYFGAGIFFAIAIAVPAVGWWRFGLNPIVAFWTAYVITRPLGASFADWFGKPHELAGGLGFGDGVVTCVLAILIVVLVGYLAITGRDVQRRSS
ncbi:Uncharacterized membrane-anchored protein [Frankineae bacterium MT45]|nr:Uncharacterized membrane-anchored protein [Frankineae bacterium MT45]